MTGAADTAGARHADTLLVHGKVLTLTLGSAWFAHDEARRGSLEVGRMADLAVLSGDYASVPVEEIGGIESLLTMVGGRIVYAAGALERPLDAGPPLR